MTVNKKLLRAESEIYRALREAVPNRTFLHSIRRAVGNRVMGTDNPSSVTRTKNAVLEDIDGRVLWL